MAELTIREYDLIGILEDESDVLERFEEFSGTQYICDIFHEISDGAVPIYTNDIWKNVSDIKEYIENAIKEGLADTSSKLNLDNIFQSGYYLYYSEALNNNLENLVYNKIVSEINEFIAKHDIELTEEKAEEIDNEINIKCTEVDNNDYIEYCEEIASEIIEEYLK
ncbi:hypothetical protein MOD25_05420 [Bacillus haynesii]|uniref:hypothetical protein n=1 Tax=Bacillus haynesii TaxID=1925021 RepID=UPI00227D9D9B|nr:hypothetical protein [Bacillus haynesii]MCY8549340.1 hypothetical protein [Bacillus haynesii]